MKKQIIICALIIVCSNTSHSMAGRFSRLANPAYRQYFKTWAPVGVAGAASGCFLYNAYNFYDASKQLHQKAKQLNRETAQLDKDVKELLQQYQMLKDIIKKETESIKELEQEEQQIRHLKSCPDQSYYQNYPVSKTLRPSDRWR